MLLTYSQIFPWGAPTNFESKISGGWEIPATKKHTMRLGDRFKPGGKIHFWMGNPRNKHQHPWIHGFNLNDPRHAHYWWKHDTITRGDHLKSNPGANQFSWPPEHHAMVPVVCAVERFKLLFDAMPPTPFDQAFFVYLFIGEKLWECTYTINMEPFSHEATVEYKNEQVPFEDIAHNDGFDNVEDFCRFFLHQCEKNGRQKSATMMGIEGQLIHWTNMAYDWANVELFTPTFNASI